MYVVGRLDLEWNVQDTVVVTAVAVILLNTVYLPSPPIAVFTITSSSLLQSA